MCINPERFFNEYYVRIVNIDTREYVRKEYPPAYHISRECERLNSDFHNYLIPKEIKERGDDEIKKYRAWFKEFLDSDILEHAKICNFRIGVGVKVWIVCQS